MGQKEIIVNGNRKLLIYVSVRCKEHPGGRIQLRRTIENIEKGSPRANALEKELLRDGQRQRAQRETNGITWNTLLNLYDVYATEKVRSGDWCQSRQTYEEAIRSMYKWTKPWFKEIANTIASSDVTALCTK